MIPVHSQKSRKFWKGLAPAVGPAQVWPGCPGEGGFGKTQQDAALKLRKGWNLSSRMSSHRQSEEAVWLLAGFRSLLTAPRPAASPVSCPSLHSEQQKEGPRGGWSGKIPGGLDSQGFDQGSLVGCSYPQSLAEWSQQPGKIKPEKLKVK